MDRGKMIVSTKGIRVGILAFGIIAALMFVPLGILTMQNPKMFAELSRRHYEIIGIFMGAFFMVLPLSLIAVAILQSKSHAIVYENGVEGFSAGGQGKQMEKFYVTYADLVNITENGKAITLYTKYTNYNVLFLKNKDLAVSEIRSRIEHTKGANS